MNENLNQNITVPKVARSFTRIAMVIFGIFLILLVPLIMFISLFVYDTTDTTNFFMFIGVGCVLFTGGILFIIKAIKPSIGTNQNTTETQKSNIIATTLTIIGLLLISNVTNNIFIRPASDISVIVLFPITILSAIYIGNRNYSLVKKVAVTIAFTIFLNAMLWAANSLFTGN